VEFVEVVRYRVKFKSKKLFDEHTFDPETGVETWFTEMNEAAPGWSHKNLLEVEERGVMLLKKVR